MKLSLGSLLAGITCVLTAAESSATDYQVIASPLTHCSSVDSCMDQTACPSGLFALGGGIIGDQSIVESSYPFIAGDQRGWEIGFRGAFYEYGVAAHANATGYVICSTNPGGYTSLPSLPVNCAIGDVPNCVAGVTCPAGWTLLSGGIRGTKAASENGLWSADGTWVVTWYPDSADYGSTVESTVQSYAICGHTPPDGLQQVSGAGNVCSDNPPSCQDTVTCPVGTVLIGGGFYGDQAEVESMGPLTASTWKVTWYNATDQFGATPRAFGQASATCASGQPPDPIFASSFEI